MAAVLPFLLVAGSALAEDPAVLVQPAARQSLPAGGLLVLDIADSVPEERIGRLFIDLDGTDITPEVQLEGRRVSYAPKARLSVGDHVLRLFEHMGGEQYSEIARWQVRVHGDKPEDTRFNALLSGQTNLMLASQTQPESREPDRFSTNGFVEADARSGGSAWDVHMHANGAMDSVRNNNPDGEVFQLGEYLVTGRAFTEGAATSLRLGNHDVGASNLVMDHFYRRGASLRLDALERLQVTLFSQDPARAVGDSNPTGVEDDDQRLNGVHARLYPLGVETKLFMETTFLSGDGYSKRRADGRIDNQTRSSEGWLGALEWQNDGDDVNLRGEIARSETDFDGKNGYLAPLSDDAWRGRAVVALLGDINPASYERTNLQLNLGHDRVGSYFYSLANHGLASDVERLSVGSDFRHDSLTINAMGFTSQNNVNDFDLPTDLTRGYQIQSSITPAFFVEDASGWFAGSLFSVGGYGTIVFRDEVPAGFAGDHWRNHTAGWNAGWSTALDAWNVSLNHQYTQYRDAVWPEYNQRSHLSELAVGYSYSDFLTITPTLQREWQGYAESEAQTHYFAALDVVWRAIPDVLENHSYASVQLNDSVSADRQYTASSEWLWTLVKAERNQPGYALGLSGQYQEIRDRRYWGRSDVGEEYRIYTSFKLQAPVGW